MTLNECVYWVGTAVIAYDAIVAWTHIFVYSRRSNWRQFQEGKHLMATIGAFALVLVYVILSTVTAGPTSLDDYPARGFVRLLIFMILGWVLTGWLVLTLRNQRRSSNRRSRER